MNRLLLRMAALGLCLGVTGQAEADYTFRTLNYPDSTFTEAHGINSFGHIVGAYDDVNHRRHGFLLIGDCYTSFDVLGSTLTGSGGINDSCEIVGRYINADGIQHGYKRLSDGITYELLPDPPDGTSPEPYAINNSGQIVGWYLAGGTTHAFLLSEGNYMRIEPSPGSPYTLAEGINNFGIIVGSYTDLAGRVHGYVRLSGGRFIYPPDVPDLILTNTIGINDLGQISGTYRDADGIRYGFVLEYGQYTTLHPPPGAMNVFASGINTSGLIVGPYTEAATGRIYGYLATPLPEPGPGATSNCLGAQ